ncbi:DUF3261 domain-containing protein [Ideonella paludis]|uniref:DUF3261 domain-containing protein n=1 Tax=Ideonella paludis TaxID=1233411 RepID=UPI003628B30D
MSPASLGCVLSAQQRIVVATQGRAEQSAEVLLEVDAEAVRLALVALGQTVARLSWDGLTLNQQRAAWAPEPLSGERVLSELQMAGWPLQAVQQALPPGWTMSADTNVRELRQAGELRLRVHYEANRVWSLDNPKQGYRLTIHTLTHSAEPTQTAALPFGSACR